MSLPPGFLDELRSRVSIAQIVGRSVTWDLRKSNQGKGDFWAPCPFHHEKTASFHVDDRKGFYYCFGCHAKGDALTFLRESQNMSFMEAVEALAREAGMAIPARDPGERQRADTRDALADVMEQAVRFFRMQLMGSQAAEARAYLDRRGLSGAQRDRWELGFAPDSRHALFNHLRQAGVAPERIIEAGLCIAPDGRGDPYDRFRGRIMFPIRDARGRCIAFGGRAMDPNARAKYLNSPETPLFDKGRTLYNIGPARGAMKGDVPLIVAEGYMDVIALVEAGFEGAVAPLGTTVTEEQLRLMWRLHPEPVIALDGDPAGVRAGLRVADLALPLIAAGQGLRFALLPAGQDPDDLIKASGPDAMRRLIEGAVPMARLLWDRETAGQVFDSPERRAGLVRRLRALCARIQDPVLREQYQREFNDLRHALFRDLGDLGRRDRGSRRRPEATAPLPGTRGSLLASGHARVDEDLRGAAVLTTLAAHPGLIDEFSDALIAVELGRDDLRALQTALLAASHAAPPEAADFARDHAALLEPLLALPHLQTLPVARARADEVEARRLLAHEFRVLLAQQGGQRETVEAMERIAYLADEGLTWRLEQANEERERARRLVMPEDTDDTDEPTANGQSALDRLIAQQVWVKKRHPRPS
ncbi:MAG: DNA primase [Pararhodobacter sp.]